MDAKEFGAFVAARRKELGMTQSDLASLLAVTDKAISRWERGLGFPDISTLEPLAKALEVSVEELLRSELWADGSVAAPTGDMLIDFVKLASVQRQEERRAIVRIAVAVIVALALLFLVTEMEMLFFAFVFIPCVCLCLSISYLAYGMWLRGRGIPAGKPLTYGGLLLLVPTLAVLSLFLAGAQGIGPVPN